MAGWLLAVFFFLMWMLRISTSNNWKKAALSWKKTSEAWESTTREFEKATKAWQETAYGWKESAETSQRLCIQYKELLVKALEGNGFPR